MMQFDPNNIEEPRYKWATYCPDRHPQFKIHKQKNHATNAIMYPGGSTPRGGIVYEYINGQWEEIDRFEQSFDCIYCGEPVTAFNNYVSTGGRVYDNSAPIRERRTVHYTCLNERGELRDYEKNFYERYMSNA